MGGGENPTYSLIFSEMFLFLFGVGLKMAARIRKLCPHCDEILAPRTYREHIRLYYDADSHTWTKKRKTGCQWSESLPHTAAVGLSDEDSLLNASYSYYYISMCYCCCMYYMQEATNTTDQGASGIVDPLASDDGETTVTESI